MTIERRTYREQDYPAVIDFLIAMNRENRDHIHWNWARFEWMIEHPEFDRSKQNMFGLWLCGKQVVGAAIYDMYFGEAFCAALPAFTSLFPEILAYAYENLRDENGLGIAICDRNRMEIKAAEAAGFVLAEQTETVMRRDLNADLSAKLPDGLTLMEIPHDAAHGDMLQWLFWQGFDHGDDRAEFEQSKQTIDRTRMHFNRHLSLGAVKADGEPVAYCCLWYLPGTDYSYVEPVCTVPAYRGKGVAKALLYEAMRRAKSLGAKQAYVISDSAFYEKLGFAFDRRFPFYWKKG